MGGGPLLVGDEINLLILGWNDPVTVTKYQQDIPVAGMLNWWPKNLLGFQVVCDHRNVRKYPKPWFQREILGTLGRVP